MSRINTKYYHDGDKRVIAKISNFKPMIDELDQVSDNKDFFLRFAKAWYDIKDIDDEIMSFTGKATCDDRDVFDMTRGNKVASLKADKKYHNNRIKSYRRMARVLREMFLDVSQLMSKHEECVEKIDDKLISEFGWSLVEDKEY